MPPPDRARPTRFSSPGSCAARLALAKASSSSAKDRLPRLAGDALLLGVRFYEHPFLKSSEGLQKFNQRNFVVIGQPRSPVVDRLRGKLGICLLRRLQIAGTEIMSAIYY